MQIKIDCFDIRQIAESGQCFRLKEHPVRENTFSLVAFGKYIEITQERGSRTVELTCSKEEFEEIWGKYFDMQTGYKSIVESINKEDEFLTKAAEFGRGIRILHQDLWEVIVSFMISQNNNIPKIKRSIEMLCVRYGSRIHVKDGYGQDQPQFTFPTPKQLRDADFKACGCGYRAKYLESLVENVLSGKINIRDLETHIDGTYADKYLRSIYGIGQKVANCIRLFGIHEISAFPVDTWINKIIKQKYNGKFPVERYAKSAGVIQQYMFYYVTMGGGLDENDV